MKNSGNLQQDGHKNFKIDGLSEITEGKVGNPKNSFSRNWAILSHPWNLQNEIAPIFYYGKIPKSSEKT